METPIAIRDARMTDGGRDRCFEDVVYNRIEDEKRATVERRRFDGDPTFAASTAFVRDDHSPALLPCSPPPAPSSAALP